MKRLIQLLTVFVLGWTLAGTAAAQETTQDHESYTAQHTKAAFADFGPKWWNQLSKQLALTIDQPPEQVDATALQNILYFATHHADKVQLRRTVPSLLTIYQQHEQTQYRMLGLAALHAIGDESAMQQLHREVQSDDMPEQLRRVTVAALNDYYREHR